MKVLKLIIKNTWRHKLRTLLTILGIAIAVMAFGMLRTIITAWYAGVEASAANRIITHHRVSIIFQLPLTYREQIQHIPGVAGVSFANWFSGIYKDVNDWRNFFPRIAIENDAYFDLFPEIIISQEDRAAFAKERNGCIVGEKIAREHGFKTGDIIPLEGDIYPGHWEFVVRGFYKGRDATVDETVMFFHWKYLDEQVRQSQPGREVNVGWYVMRIQNPNDIPRISGTIDEMYLNSRASTKTETEKEFQQSFVSMSSAILTSINVISFVIIGIILLVLANTIVMAVRERTREYAVLKTLGFSKNHLIQLIGGESMVIALAGGVLGLVFTFPVAGGFAKAFPTFFPVFNVEPITITMAFGAAVVAGIAAATFPASRILRMKIVDGLRTLE
ncbi:MAG: FtsX-like permease family protein [Ignavibacteriae bacterium]|nr:FtsX-like permease family protein [Ignavibacteriota bacterium]